MNSDFPPFSSTLWTPQPTQDGSFTFFSEEFGETFHSTQGAKAEAFDKFAQATDLAQQSVRNQLCLIDVCYGLGYNTAAALETIWDLHPHCTIELYALELDASVPQAALASPLIDAWSSDVQAILKQIALTHHCTTPRLKATLLIGDARQTVQQLHSCSVQADAIFFDPFSPRRCPQLWTVEFFAQVAQCLAPSGKLATYSRSASVRTAMQEAGLQIGSIPLGETYEPLGETYEPHEWSQGTIAAFSAETLPPLSPMEQEHLQTRAAIPYRDPTLKDSPTTILERHQQEQQQSQRESTSSWRRRWHIK